MLEAILGWSIRHRLLVLLGALGLVIGGSLAFRALPIDAFPDTTPVQVQINTVAPALVASSRSSATDSSTLKEDNPKESSE